MKFSTKVVGTVAVASAIAASTPAQAQAAVAPGSPKVEGAIEKGDPGPADGLDLGSTQDVKTFFGRVGFTDGEVDDIAARLGITPSQYFDKVAKATRANPHPTPAVTLVDGSSQRRLVRQRIRPRLGRLRDVGP